MTKIPPIEQLRKSTGKHNTATSRHASPKLSMARFIKGPIPLEWVERAARLPGRSLHVALALWYLAGLKRSMTVSVSNRALESFGIDRFAKRRALDWMEKAGLVRVEKVNGRSPTVTIACSETPEK